jgi:hypothetical protein
MHSVFTRPDANIRGATQVRAVTSLLITAQNMPSPGNHQPPPWCPGWLPSAISSLTTYLRLALLNSIPHMSIPCPTHTFFPLSPSQIGKTASFLGHPKLLSLSSIGSLGGRVRARRTNGSWGPLFHFFSASYIIRNLRPASYIGRQSECKTSVFE